MKETKEDKAEICKIIDGVGKVAGTNFRSGVTVSKPEALNEISWQQL